MVKQYFIKRGDTVNGPFTSNQIKSGITSKKLNPEDLLGSSEVGPWKELRSVIKVEAGPGDLSDRSSVGGELPAIDTTRSQGRNIEKKASSADSSQKNVLALVSLGLGISSVTMGCCCYLNFPLGIAAVITGILGILKANKEGLGGKGMAITGIVLGVVALTLITLFYVLYISALMLETMESY